MTEGQAEVTVGSGSSARLNVRVSRRRLLAILATAAGTVDVAVHADDVAREQLPPDDPYIGSALRYRGVTIEPLIVEHNETSAQRNLQRVKEIAAEYRTVVPEYFPPEYAWIENLPLVGGLLSVNDHPKNNLFHDLISFWAEKQTNLWVLDPAYGGDLAFFRFTGPGLVSAAAIGVALSNVLAPWTMRMGQYGFDPHSRRDLVVRGIRIALGVGGFLGFFDHSTGSSEEIELLTRQAAVAHHLKGLCLSGQFKKGESVLAIYPEQHWLGAPHLVGIERFFHDDSLREGVLSVFSSTYGHAFPGLLAARHYPAGRYRPNAERQLLSPTRVGREPLGLA